MDQLPRNVLTSVAALGCAGFVVLERAVARGRTGQLDHTVRDEAQARQTPVAWRAAEAVDPIGQEWLHIPVAGMLALGLWMRQRSPRVLMPALASITSEAASRLFDLITYDTRRVPPKHPHQNKPSFPSGHALEASAVSLTTAYVLARERLVGARPAFALAVAASVASPAGKIYRDRHWMTDAVGGWCIGTAIAAACAAVYEEVKGRECSVGTQC